MGSVPYTHTSKAFDMVDPPQKRLHVRIDPQFHEMILDMGTIYSKAQQMDIPPQEAMPLVMIDLLRDQALDAYNTVMRGGLTALAGRNMEASEVESTMQHYVEIAARSVEKAEEESARWQELATRRGIEVNALERAIARRGEG